VKPWNLTDLSKSVVLEISFREVLFIIKILLLQTFSRITQKEVVCVTGGEQDNNLLLQLDVLPEWILSSVCWYELTTFLIKLICRNGHKTTKLLANVRLVRQVKQRSAWRHRSHVMYGGGALKRRSARTEHEGCQNEGADLEPRIQKDGACRGGGATGSSFPSKYTTKENGPSSN
jgi:hypothetical protein